MRHLAHCAGTESEPEQEALFELQGPDEDGCVWACSPKSRDVWCQNLGPTAKVAEVMSQWLGSIDCPEVETGQGEVGQSEADDFDIDEPEMD